MATADTAHVPPTVVDAVPSRLRRLDPVTRAKVEQLAVMPSASASTNSLGSCRAAGVLSPAEEGGLLTVQPEGVQFRHELTRRAIVDALPASRRIELEPGCSSCCSGRRRQSRSSPTRRGGRHRRDRPWAPGRTRRRGQRRAPAGGRALPCGAGAHRPLRPADRTELLEGYAIEAYTVGDEPERRGPEPGRRLRRITRQDRARASLRWLSRFQWLAGDRPAAEGRRARRRQYSPARTTADCSRWH